MRGAFESRFLRLSRGADSAIAKATAGSGTVTLDAANGQAYEVPVTGDITIANPRGGLQGGSLFVRLTGSGGSVSWGDAFEFPGGTAPTPTGDADASDGFLFVRHGDAWVQVLASQNMRAQLAPKLFVLHYGQSLSIGSIPSAGASVVNGTAHASALRIGPAVRAHLDFVGLTNSDRSVDFDQLQDLQALAEIVNPNGEDWGETLAYGFADGLEGESVHCSMGRGAQKADQLDEGEIHFANAVIAGQTAHDLVVASGRRFDYAGIAWMQGEADATAAAGTDPATWKTTVEDIWDDLIEYFNARFSNDPDVAAITRPPMLTVQLANTNYNGGSSGVASLGIMQAQLELGRDTADFLVVAPGYCFPLDDGVHMTAASYNDAGEKMGRVLKEYRSSGSWSPCYITGATGLGTTTITLAVNVPVGPLTENTTEVSSKADKGFELFDSGGSAVSISSVTVGSSGVTIEAATTAATTVRYAMQATTALVAGAQGASSPGGNICDSDTYTSPSGRALPNWLLAQEVAIS